jgi:hypothetical protein
VGALKEPGVCTHHKEKHSAKTPTCINKSIEQVVCIKHGQVKLSNLEGSREDNPLTAQSNKKGLARRK